MTANETLVPISSDSHVVEPTNCYRDHIEAKYRDIAPHIGRVERDGKPVDVYVVDGIKEQIPVMGIASAGRSAKEQFNTGTLDLAEHQGGWDPKARLADQDRDGIAAEIIYPSLGMVLCGHPDGDYKNACFNAYNRWLQDYCSIAPNRLFGLGQTAIRSVKEAIADMERIKAMGFKGVMLPGFPAMEGDYSDAAFDPLWEAAVALDMPLSFHVLTGKRDEIMGGASGRGKSRLSGFVNLVRAIQDIFAMFVFDGVFERHPNLKLVCTEADAGWLPHFAGRADHAYKRFEGTIKQPRMSKLPSEFFRDNIWVTFQDDISAFELAGMDMLNSDRLMWANDFPHSDSTWPHSQALLGEFTVKLTDHQKRRILRDNVAELYKLPVAA
jgi:predicted TIM-barrel fold metal-dependent hydrolase